MRKLWRVTLKCQSKISQYAPKNYTTTLKSLRRICFIRRFIKAIQDEDTITFVLDEMGIGTRPLRNYGFDKIRFPSPVPAGSKIRSTSTLRRAEIKGSMIETMNEVVVEAEGTDKPVCVAESVGRMVF